MIRKVGELIANENSSYLYFIIKDGYLYIGESMSPLAERWGSHTQDGTFQKKLLEIDEDAYSSDTPFLYIGYECEAIDIHVSLIEKRFVLRYIEHKVHYEFAKGVESFDLNLTVISDTSRTAPQKCSQHWGEDLAYQIFESFINDYRNLLDRQR